MKRTLANTINEMRANVHLFSTFNFTFPFGRERFIIILSFIFFCLTGLAQNHTVISGNIKNYSNKPLYLYKCFGDSLIFIDSIKTDEKGRFTAYFQKSFNPEKNNSGIGIYRFNLISNQWFYLLSPLSQRGEAGNEVKIKTVYRFDMFNNWATDNMEVIKSEENKMFYKFQLAQKKINLANYVMKEMMRLYPLHDPFHKVIEKEYLQRYKALDDLFGEVNKNYPHTSSVKVINAYYQPVNPDWREADNWSDSIIAAHYFDYFHPEDEFYLHTNILPEKIDNYFDLFSFLTRVNRETVSDYEIKIKTASDEFLKHTVSNPSVHEFCLQYILKKLEKEKMLDALYSVYDKWVVNASAGDCVQSNPALNKWREKVSVLRNIQIGSKAPDFEVVPGRVNLYNLPADYTLLVYWASWCPHCVDEIPKTKKAIEDFQNANKEKSLASVFISLDNEEKVWKEFVEKNGLGSYIHLCDFKGWKGGIVKRYNVFATPTMFLLDKDKRIINKPENTEQLKVFLLKN